MINFHRVAGIQLVANEEEAYRYWLRTVRGCLKAEEAFGPAVVYRVRYADIISNPESTMRLLLGFLGEPYTATCLEPLAHRINSSEVPADFKSNDSGTDPSVIREAMRLCAEVEETPQPRDPSPAAVNELEAAFENALSVSRRLGYRLPKHLRIIKVSSRSPVPLYVMIEIALAIVGFQWRPPIGLK